MSRRAKDAADASSALANGSSSKQMDYKGETLTSAVGKCMSVLYDEGSAELIAYRGVVVYVERSRCVAAAHTPDHPRTNAHTGHPMAWPPRHSATQSSCGANKTYYSPFRLSRAQDVRRL